MGSAAHIPGGGLRRTGAIGCSCRRPHPRTGNPAGRDQRTSRCRDINGKLPLGAEHQVVWQAHDQRLHRVLEVLGRYPLPGADQRVPGLLPHIRQVHHSDPVRHLAHTPQVLPLTPAVAHPCFCWLVSPIAPIRSARRPPWRRAASSSPATTNRRTTPIAAKVSQTARLSSRWSAAAPGLLPVALGQVTGQGADVLARLQPRLGPHKAAPQQSQQLTTFPGRQRGPNPGSSSRLRFVVVTHA